LPGIAPVAVVGLYLTPVSVVGCASRGIAAFAVVLISLLAGVGMAIQAIRIGRLDREASTWWALSAAILAVPAALVLGPLG
jgi:hypothetical protein